MAERLPVEYFAVIPEVSPQKAGKEVHYLELDGGTHHLRNNKTRLATFRAMETFLAKYLSD